MAPLLPSSPSISTAYSPVLQNSTHKSRMDRPVPPAPILPRAKFHPISPALPSTARARKSSPCSLRSAVPLGRGRARLSSSSLISAILFARAAHSTQAAIIVLRVAQLNMRAGPRRYWKASRALPSGYHSHLSRQNSNRSWWRLPRSAF